MRKGRPTTIIVRSAWPTKVHRLYLPSDPLVVAGLKFFTKELSLSIHVSFVSLQQLVERKQVQP
jgi:hypothetical protein